MGKRGNRASNSAKRKALKRSRSEAKKNHAKDVPAPAAVAPYAGVGTPYRAGAFDDEPEAVGISQHGRFHVMAVGDTEEEVRWLLGGIQAIGNADILVPEKVIEMEYLEQAAENFTSILSPGTYSDTEQINEAFKRQAAFLNGLLSDILGRCGDEATIEFLVYEHDQWKIATRWAKDNCDAFPDGSVSRLKVDWVLQHYALARRALKNLIERAVMLFDPRQKYDRIEDAPDKRKAFEERFRCVQRAFVLSEELVNVITWSDSTYRLFPDDTHLRVHDPDEEQTYLVVHSERGEALFDDFRERERRFQAGDWDLVVGVPSQAQVDALNDAVRSELGFSVTDAFETLEQMRRGIHAENSWLGHAAVSEVRRQLANILGVPETKAEAIIRGWAVYRDNIDWRPHKPKRGGRMLTRPLVIIDNHPEGPHVVVPQETIVETSQMALDVWRRRGAGPVEWQAAPHGTVEKSLRDFGAAQDKRLEGLTEESLSRLGVTGMSVHTDTLRPQGLVIPDDVGEIDYLGVVADSRVVLVIENKNLLAATDPAGYHEEIGEFTSDYVPQVLRKSEWIRANASEVLRALGGRLGFEVSPGTWRVVPLLVTNHEHFVAGMVADARVTSLMLLSEDIANGGFEFLARGGQSVDV